MERVPPEPTRITPSRGWNGEATRVVVVGERFYPRVEVDASSRQEAQVNAGYSVYLQRPPEPPLALQGVSLQDYGHIDATVPAGLAPGLYDVVVEGPTGLRGLLPEAFTVSPIRADRIVLDTPSVLYEVFETAWVDISLIDPQGRPVLTDLAVVVVVTDANGTVEATFEPGGLEGQQSFGSGFGILGRLGSDGAARVGFTLSSPNTVDVVVAPGAGNAQQVTEGTLKLRFDPGADLALEIALPDSPFETVAGTSFPVELALVDQYGNPAPDASELVVLRDACNDWVGAVTVHGSATADVVVRRATQTASCPIDRILSVAGPAGASEAFHVRPGPPAGLQVVTSPNVVAAGEPALDAVITAVDTFGNTTAWVPSGLAITDSVDGVIQADCGSVTPVFCTITSTLVGEGITLEVIADGDLKGRSGGHTVVAGAPGAVIVAGPAGPVVAGEIIEVEVEVHDAWGNPVSVEASAVAVSLPGDSGACVPLEASSPPAWACTPERARADAVARAEVATASISGDSAPFEVHNAALASATLTPDANTVGAGAPFTLVVEAFDAYGNAYTTQSDPVLALYDTAGSLSIASVTLDASGARSVQATLTHAGPTEVRALQGDQELGRSATITVEAGAAQALRVAAAEPWGWVGAPLPFVVEAVDAWGNGAAWDGAVTLAASAAVEAVAVEVVGGLGAGSLWWDAPALDATATATGGSLVEGASSPFSVFEACADGGPSAHLTFDGHAHAITCLDEDGEGRVFGDLGGSTAGDGAIARWGLRVGDAWAVSATESALEVPVRGIGRAAVEGLVADAAGCADVIASTAWTAPPDGRATGPIAVALAQSSVPVGSGSTTITLSGVRDCAREPAAGAVVRLRASRGAIDGLYATGAGLALTLGSTGGGAAILDATAAHTGGGLEVVAWSEGGAGDGSATATLTGDLRGPAIWRMDPAGDAVGLVDTVRLEFSEPLAPESVTDEAFGVAGPSTVDVSAALEAGDQVVLLHLDPSVDAGAGVWWVSVDTTVHDAFGNPLEGEGPGESAPFVAAFGDLPSAAPPVTGCVPSRERFRPDGDDGPGDDADRVVVTLASASAPSAWVAEVWRDGVRLLVERRPGDEGTWSWDGRDATGAVVASGAVTLRIDAEDEDGNRGGACEASVTVAQHAEVDP